VADEVIQREVKKRNNFLLDLDESELSDFCPDSATLNSRYGSSYRVQDTLVRRVMPHRLAKLKQDVSGFLNLHDEEQILERITSQDWSGLALKPTLDMGRGVMATRFFRSGSVVCDYHGPVLKKDQAESLRRSIPAAKSNYMYFFKHDSQRLCIDAATVPCVCHPRIPTTFGRLVNHSGVHPNLRTVCRRIGDRVHLLLVATKDVNPNDYGVRSDDEGSRLSFLLT